VTPARVRSLPCTAPKKKSRIPRSSKIGGKCEINGGLLRRGGTEVPAVPAKEAWVRRKLSQMRKVAAHFLLVQGSYRKRY